MKRQIIRLTSVTYAMRAQKLLAQHGILSHVRKLAIHLNITGCGYGLEVVGDVRLAVQILSAAGIRVVQVTEEEIQ